MHRERAIEKAWRAPATRTQGTRRPRSQLSPRLFLHISVAFVSETLRGHARLDGCFVLAPLLPSPPPLRRRCVRSDGTGGERGGGGRGQQPAVSKTDATDEPCLTKVGRPRARERERGEEGWGKCKRKAGEGEEKKAEATKEQRRVLAAVNGCALGVPNLSIGEPME